MLFIAAITGMMTSSAADAPHPEWAVEPPEIIGQYGLVPEYFEDYDVVLKPEKDAAEWWSGAPSVVRDDDGVFWLAARMRSPERPRGLRGYEIRIMRSEDGVDFEKVHGIYEEDIPVQGFERPAMLIDPETGQFKLYGCGPWGDKGWSIFKLDDVDSPTEFDAATARNVIAPRELTYPRDVPPEGYKDPFIIYADGAYHCYVIGQLRRIERVYHFKSHDGENWEPVGNPYRPIMDLKGWRDFFVRPASVVPVGVGYLFFYEGSSTKWYDPVYNIGTGVAFTFDLHNIIDLTPDSPLVVSTTPSENLYTWRYSHWMKVDGELWVYAEVANPNESHEIRRFTIPIKR